VPHAARPRRRYDPRRDKSGWVIEEVSAYVRRMQRGPLPSWPDEVLREWLHRHAGGGADKYEFLGFERFRFTRETWPLEKVPGTEACERNWSNFAWSPSLYERATEPYDWLAQFMVERGTWNTPVILLENHEARLTFPWGDLLKHPYHLLEGHRRLSFLERLRHDGRALPMHDVWLVRLADT
jgi:hypothetical protein